MNLRFIHRFVSLSIFLPLLVVLFHSCASADDFRMGEPFRLKKGESARASGVTITFTEVASDSRCPQQVTCIWEGDADVRLTLNGATASVHTSAKEQRSARVGGYTVELLELRPRPQASPTTPAAYEVELRVIPAE